MSEWSLHLNVSFSNSFTDYLALKSTHMDFQKILKNVIKARWKWNRTLKYNKLQYYVQFFINLKLLIKVWNDSN